MTELDRNDDGEIDVWTFTDQSNVLVRMICDDNFDGVPDDWRYLKNSKPFLDQENRDFDGKSDWLMLQVYDEEDRGMRGFIFTYDGNIFVKTGDTGWVDSLPTG